MDHLLKALQAAHTKEELQYEEDLFEEMDLLHEPENEGTTLAAALSVISEVANNLAEKHS